MKQKAFTPLNSATPTARKRYLAGFTLIELMITITIVALMAVVAIPNFNKHQRLIDLQNKSDEVKAALDEMHLKALNPEKGKDRYYAQVRLLDEVGNIEKIDFGYLDGVTPTPYRTIQFNSYQSARTYLPLPPIEPISKQFIVCDKGQNFCCNTEAVGDVCNAGIEKKGDFIQIAIQDKLSIIKIKASFIITNEITDYEP